MTDLKINDFAKPEAKKAMIESKAKEYQEVFTAKMLNIMFENVKFDPFTEKESAFKSLLVDEYAQYLAPTMEIDKHITKTLLELQEMHDSSSKPINANEKLKNDIK